MFFRVVIEKNLKAKTSMHRLKFERPDILRENQTKLVEAIYEYQVTTLRLEKLCIHSHLSCR